MKKCAIKINYAVPIVTNILLNNNYNAMDLYRSKSRKKK